MKKSGFTLIELIVSIGVISLVTGIFLANYSSANRRSDLTMTTQKMISDIHMAQNYSLGLTNYGLKDSINVPLGGWGIHFDLTNDGNQQYVIFADDDGDKLYSSSTEANLAKGASIITLPRNIIIDSISTGNKTDITFLPPDPITTITGSLGTSTQADIVLKDQNTNTKKTVRINFLGLAEAID